MTDNSIHPLSSAIDEAIWAAYRRDDKVAVMDYLFHRSLVGIGRSRSFPQLVIKSLENRSRSGCTSPISVDQWPRKLDSVRLENSAPEPLVNLRRLYCGSRTNREERRTTHNCVPLHFGVAHAGHLGD